MFLDKVVNFKDFSTPNKEIKYLSRTSTEFKDFSRQLLKLKTFSRLYEPCYYIVIVVCSNFQTKNPAAYHDSFFINPFQFLSRQSWKTLFWFSIS